MYLVLCHVSGKTDLVTPINSVLWCLVKNGPLTDPRTPDPIDKIIYFTILLVIS